MAYITPKNLTAPKAPQINYWPSNPVLLNGGLNLVDKEWKVSDNQSSKILNMWFRDGELSKRWGQEYVNADIETPIFNSYRFKYEGKIIFNSGTKLYSLDTDTGLTTELYNGLTAIKGSFFKFNQKLYYINGHEYIEYDGTTVKAVEPYIPTVIINRTPTGGGSTNEEYNRIGKGFKNSFNGNGSAVAYQLTDSNLDATTVKVTIGGVTKTEGTDFSVNRTTGIVTFVSAPATGQNNVIITAYKTDQVAIDSILKCKYAIPFGGQNDNRMFFAGNGTGYFYYTGITAAGIDASYFPYNNYNIIGNPDEDITGFGNFYEVLTIHKESGEIYGETYTFDGTKGIFNTFPINGQYGCDCSDTLQNVNNNLVWLNSRYGVCILVGTQVESQRNAFPISRNVNPRLLNETNLKQATSIEFNGKYWLCVNDKVYLWDYFISPYVSTGNPEASAKVLSWWYFDNINAGSWIADGQDLYYADRTVGRVVKFHREYDNQQFYDFGNGINAIYRYPFREMGNGVYEFSVLRGWVNVRGDLYTSFLVMYFTSDDPSGDSVTENIDVGSFSWEHFSWPNFTWNVMGPVFQWELTPYEKNIRYFGAEFTNSEAGKDMNIGSIIWQYRIGKMIK